ncbi:MAG: hypothetical protein K8T25_23190 [Planctomycetia bacterium]|nr:hypothetical protein [Planctomycetia bacterium]
MRPENNRFDKVPPRPSRNNSHPIAPDAGGVAPSRPLPARAVVLSSGRARPVAAAPAMAGAATAGALLGNERANDGGGMLGQVRSWFLNSGNSYLASMLFHTALFLLLALVLGVRYVAQSFSGGKEFEAAVVEDESNNRDALLPTLSAEKFFDKFKTAGPDEKFLTEAIPSGPASLGGPKISDDPTYEPPRGGFPDADPAAPPMLEGGIGFHPTAPGAAANGTVGLHRDFGEGYVALGGGPPYRGRGTPPPPGSGKTRATEDSALAALNWIARHQSADGSWSLDKFDRQCHLSHCDGGGNVQSDAAATALALLPFLAHGMTHLPPNSDSPPEQAKYQLQYQQTVRRGLMWLLAHQQRSGDLSAGTSAVMYTHGLATIALCEAYGMTRDATRQESSSRNSRNGELRLGSAAQAAVRFIETAQNKQDGGWRYKPGDAGDTSVVGWQVMALKSAQMAGLEVSPVALEGAQKWLAAASGSQYGGLFSYTAGGGKTTTMSSVGLLCRQYLGAAKSDPGINEGVRYLMANLPDGQADRNIYYWYYATQVMHNMYDGDWEKWNRQMRRVLCESQCRQGCAVGSWDPAKPTADAWGAHGGRLMVTALSCLTLEVYYRYMPLYDLRKQGAVVKE